MDVCDCVHPQAYVWTSMETCTLCAKRILTVLTRCWLSGMWEDETCLDVRWESQPRQVMRQSAGHMSGTENDDNGCLSQLTWMWHNPNPISHKLLRIVTHTNKHTREQVIHWVALMHGLTRAWNPGPYSVGGTIVLRSHDLMKNIVLWLSRFSVNHFRCMFVAADWAKSNNPCGCIGQWSNWLCIPNFRACPWMTDWQLSSCRHSSSCAN